MGNTSSERAGLERQGEKGHRRGTKDGERPKILMDSPEDADIFHGEDMKAPLEKEEFLAWRQDLEVSDKAPTQARPTVFRWTGAGKDVFVSGSFNNWVSKIPLTRSQNNFVAIVDLPEGEHQYKFYVDGQWTHDPSEPVVTNQLGTVNNLIQVKKTDFEVFDALLVDSLKSSDVSGEAACAAPHTAPWKGCTCIPAHLYALSIKDGVMVLSATHRYKKKFVTTLLYKPI
nr:PREDICTED: 5'-AMP-activated protein kinase subunit beta-1 [Lepisosteus oculatus]